MSEIYSEADLSMAFNDGHNDGWNSKPPRPAPKGMMNDPKHQSYRRGHEHGITARYWYNKGFFAGRTYK